MYTKGSEKFTTLDLCTMDFSLPNILVVGWTIDMIRFLIPSLYNSGMSITLKRNVIYVQERRIISLVLKM